MTCTIKATLFPTGHSKTEADQEVEVIVTWALTRKLNKFQAARIVGTLYPNHTPLVSELEHTP